MPDQKISQLSSGTNAQAGDLFVIARGASNFNLTTAQLFNAPSVAATFASLTVDTDTLFVDAANNRVGVGTATPDRPLTVAGNLSATNNVTATDALRLVRSSSSLELNIAKYWNGTGNPLSDGNKGDMVAIGNAGGDGLILVNGNTERARIDSSGNLGLGVTPSAWEANRVALQIGGSTSGHLAYNAATGNLTTNAFFDTTDSRYEYVGTGAATRYEQAAGVHAWYNAASGSANGAITFTQAMTLDASGNLGVGVSSGLAVRFTVDGRQRFSGSQVGSAIENQPTAISVTTSAVTIHDDAGSLGRLCVVNGLSGADRFCDLVLCSTSVAPVVVQSFTASGSPVARTYTRSGSALQLAMASGTYDVFALSLGY